MKKYLPGFLLALFAALCVPVHAATVEDATYSETSAGTNQFVVDFPATVNADDVFVVCAVLSDETYTPTTPTDWTLIQSTLDFTIGIWSYWYVADGTEDGGSQAFSVPSTTVGRSSHYLLRISGADTTNPIAASAESSGFDFATTHTVTDVTTTADDQLVVTCLGKDGPSDPMGATAPTSPSAHTLVGPGENGTFVGVAMSYYTQASAGSTGGSVTWTGLDNSNQNQSNTFAILDASGGGAVIPVLHHQLRNQ